MTNKEKLIKLKNDKNINKTKRDILKRSMSGKYCNKTYFDFLDSEERLAIYQAMEDYADLARADERAKMQGVDVWVSVDEDGTTKLSESELEFFEREKWGMFKYPERGFCVALPHQFGEFLKVEEGECAKFRIVRQP